MVTDRRLSVMQREQSRAELRQVQSQFQFQVRFCVLSLCVGPLGPITGQKVKPIEWRSLRQDQSAAIERQFMGQIGLLTKLAAAATRFIIARRSSIE